MEIWTKDILEKKLGLLQRDGKILQWAIFEKEINREEKYLMREKIVGLSTDQARTVYDSSTLVKLEVKKENGKIGSAQKKIFPQLELIPQLNSLIENAIIGEEDIWSYEAKLGNSNIQFNNSDPLIWESTTSSIDRLCSALEKSIDENPSLFNSAELFVSKIQETTKLSNGFIGNEVSSKIYAEVCFSAEDAEKKNAEEFMVKKYSTRIDQIDFQQMCRDSIEYAQKSLFTEKPIAGRYPVILYSSELNQLFHDVIEHINANAKYYKTPFISKGEELIPQFSGDNFKLYLDPEMKYAFESKSFDHYGDQQKKILLVEGNIVKNTITSKKMADYLSWQKTASTGVIVVDPSKTYNENQLRKLEPKVLEILQLSALFSNASDLTFSSEIRLARLWDTQTGKATYIKGGSISGNFKESFSKVRWSDKRRLENADDMNGIQSYYGPSCALLLDISVAS